LLNLVKTLTGIQGLDEITEGGLPRSRPIIVSGKAGSGKMLIGIVLTHSNYSCSFPIARYTRAPKTIITQPHVIIATNSSDIIVQSELQKLP
jgi:hypothetical protein